MRGYIMRRSRKVIKTLRVHLEEAVSAGPSVFTVLPKFARDDQMHRGKTVALIVGRAGSLPGQES